MSFCDTTKSSEERARILIGMLTPEEKGSLMTARTTARSNAIPRLGIPDFCWGQNSAQGYLQTSLPSNGGRGVTTFPRAPGMAATWNLSAIKRQGLVFGTEARNGETASEDPLFNSLYGAAYATGAQQFTEAPEFLKTIVTLKHWGAYSVDYYKNGKVEYIRQSFDANVSLFDMWDSYAPSFEKAVTGTVDPTTGERLMGAKGIMASYNSINGVPSCASKWMQTDILRYNWSFDGYVVGDSDTVQFVNTEHHYVNTPAAAVQATIHAGTDLESWTTGNSLPNYYRDIIPIMLRNGTLNESLVDLSLSRLLKLRFQTGLMNPHAERQPFFNISSNDRGTAEFAEDALDAARQSMTLLLNKNVLPLKPGSSNVAVIGPYHQYGSKNTSFDEEIRTMNIGATTESVSGSSVNGDDKTGFPAAIAASKAADVIILVLGTDGSQEHESKDRNYITLPPIQSELALAVLSAGKEKKEPSKVIVVLINYGEISVEELLGPDKGIDGLLMAFWPSKGTPIAEALFGKFNVGGKLPYTIYPNNYTDLVAFGDMRMTAGPGRGYRYYIGKPLFPFGYGLSYTTFRLNMLSVQKGHVNVGHLRSSPVYSYSVGVTNTGSHFGTETVQMYFVPPKLPNWGAPLPRRRLLGWRKVEVGIGDTVRVHFTLSGTELALINAAGEKVQVHGNYTILFTNG
eukprot:UC4_evm1s853